MAAATSGSADKPALITTALPARSVDANQRQKRYLISMGVRVCCFIGGVMAPSPWNWVLFVGAAVIPPVAVMLANTVDLRAESQLIPEQPTTRPALESGETLPGSVEE